jgi:hypothetical protein
MILDEVNVMINPRILDDVNLRRHDPKLPYFLDSDIVINHPQPPKTDVLA